jgi:branched-chain amino acid transport system permease protein
VAFFIQSLITGLAIGAVYGLVGLGFMLLVNTTNILNFAQGEFGMLGAFMMVTFAINWGIPYIPALAMVLVGAAVIGVIFERIAYRPLKGADGPTYFAATLAAAVVIRNIGLKIWGPYALPFQEPFGLNMITLGGVRIRPQDLLIVAVVIVLSLLLYFFFYRTRTGKIMRAMSQDRPTAQLLGVRVLSMGTLTFIMASMMGALAGVLVAPIYFVSLDMGFTLGLKAFIATIIGAWGSLPGAIIGGLIIGVVETFGAVYISSVYKDVFAFALLIVFLIIRPQGIFGEKIADKV